MGKPLVSVGIPAYNRADGLKKSLESISNQTYADLEIIVSDDCSPDDRVSQVVNEKMLSEKRIRFYRQESNLGAVLNFEFVLDKAKGKYFFWADDEDLCEPEFIEKIVNCMESEPDLVACACDVKSVDHHDQVVKINQLSSIRPSAKWNQARELFFRYPTSNIYLCILGIFKTEAVKKVDIRYLAGWKGYATNGEVPFLAQIAALGRIAAIPEILKTYRLNPGSLYHTEIVSISGFDLFMLRLTIRLRLCKIAVMSHDSVAVKKRLIQAVLMSFLESNLNSLKGILGPLKKLFKT
jgi:glycosyltransferase involved in cell wall biosynthesis